MKIKQDFAPVTIVFEKEHEVLDFKRLLEFTLKRGNCYSPFPSKNKRNEELLAEYFLERLQCLN